jgi:hypothetical protein
VGLRCARQERPSPCTHPCRPDGKRPTRWGTRGKGRSIGSELVGLRVAPLYTIGLGASEKGRRRPGTTRQDGGGETRANRRFNGDPSAGQAARVNTSASETAVAKVQWLLEAEAVRSDEHQRR